MPKRVEQLMKKKSDHIAYYKELWFYSNCNKTTKSNLWLFFASESINLNTPVLWKHNVIT